MRRLKTKDARVVELVDSLASGASALYGRAGSTPASRTNPVDVSSTGFFWRFSMKKPPVLLGVGKILQYK